MFNDKRKSTRREMRYSAWVALAQNQLLGCALSDISETGARIEAENADQLPDQFMLLLSSRGTPKRKCRVIWRDGNHVGVEFERRLEKPHPFRRKYGMPPPAADAPPVAPADATPVAAEDEASTEAKPTEPA